MRPTFYIGVVGAGFFARNYYGIRSSKGVALLEVDVTGALKF